MTSISQDTLFLACTRPAMAFGLPVDAFALLMVCGGEVWVIVQRPLIVGPLLLLAYGACRIAAAYDPHIFMAMFLWARTWGRCSINSEHWGGASVSPSPKSRAKKSKEIVLYV